MSAGRDVWARREVLPMTASRRLTARYLRSMSWAVMARRVRNSDLAIGQRVTALHSLLANHHAPLGFEATRQHLRRTVGVTRREGWSEPGLLLALDLLEASRANHIAYRVTFGQRRKVEKASSRRSPTKADLEALTRAEWFLDPDEATVRRQSTRELRKGVGASDDRREKA